MQINHIVTLKKVIEKYFSLNPHWQIKPKLSGLILDLVTFQKYIYKHTCMQTLVSLWMCHCKLTNFLWQVGGFLWVLWFPPPINLTTQYNWNIILVKVALNTITLTLHVTLKFRWKVWIVVYFCLKR